MPPQYPFILAAVPNSNFAGIALDAAGNIYAAVQGSTSIMKISPGGGSSVNIGSGFSTPTGVAVDGAGNVYVVDGGNKVIKKIPAGNGTVTTYASGFGYPSGIAIDKTGSLYVTDISKNVVERVPAGGGTPVTVVNGLSAPAGIAVDGSGNIYIANQGDNTVREAVAGSTTTTILASGFNKPYGMAVDAGGNVFVTDQGNKAVKRIPAGGQGGTPAAIATAITFKTPTGIALDAAHNIYIADSGTATLSEINPGYFINLALPPGLSLNESTGVISGTPTAVSPETNYSVSAYNSGGVDGEPIQLTVNPYQLPSVSYVSPQVYAANSAITPLAPKSNAVFPGNFGIATPTIFASGLNTMQGIAVDIAGNVYVAEAGNNSVVKISPSGGNVVTVGSGINGLTGVAVDEAGNVYLSHYYSGSSGILEITPSGTTISLGSGFSDPQGVAVDAMGNVYVADFERGLIKIPGELERPFIYGPILFILRTVLPSMGAATFSCTATVNLLFMKY